jgi:hypothetical protein
MMTGALVGLDNTLKRIAPVTTAAIAEEGN